MNVFVERLSVVREQDVYQKGNDPNTDSGYRDTVARMYPSLEEAKEKLAIEYGLHGYAVGVMSDPNGRHSLRFTEHETDYGSVPSDAEVAAWKAGEFRLWDAEYIFYLHFVEVLPDQDRLLEEAGRKVGAELL